MSPFHFRKYQIGKIVNRTKHNTSINKDEDKTERYLCFVETD